MRIDKSDLVRATNLAPAPAAAPEASGQKMAGDQLIRSERAARSGPQAKPPGGLRQAWNNIMSFLDRPSATERRQLGGLLVGGAALTAVASVTALVTLPLTASALVVSGAVFGGVAAFTALASFGAYYLSTSSAGGR